MNYKEFTKYIGIVFLCGTLTISCQDSIDRNNEVIPYSSVGGYQNSDEIAINNLISKINFDNSLITDSKNGFSNGTNFGGKLTETGIKGNAYQGSTTAFISYNDVSDKIKNIKSITQSMWIKTSAHQGGAQCIFMLPKSTDFWGNIFILIEGSTDGKMLLKFHIQKDVTPSVAWAGQFIELNGSNMLENMYDKWKHLVWSYDATASTFALYVDGVKIKLPDGLTKRFTDDPTKGGMPLGDLANSNVLKFVIGAYQQHVGAPWSAPDTWMLKYTGMIDEFRLYDKALSDGEINALYTLEKDNR